MWPDSQKTEYLVTITEEIHNGRVHFLCSDEWQYKEASFWRKMSKSCQTVKQVMFFKRILINNIFINIFQNETF